MKSRDRVLLTLEGKTADRTPMDYKSEPEVNERMLRDLGASDYDALLEKLDVDIRRLAPAYIGPAYRIYDDNVVEDYWGIRSINLPASCGSYDMHVHNPLWDARDVDDLAGHAWPTPDIFDYSVMREQRERYADYAIMYEGADLFTRPCILRNMENVMLDMALRPDMAHYLFNQFTEFYCEDVRRAAEATDGGFDIYGQWSDYGTQRALLMSIPMWREFIEPYLSRLIDTVHACGAKFMLHSCGAVRELIPEFIRVGVDILDPIQVAAEGMDPMGLKRDFGKEIIFHGGVCTQTTLPFGGADDVRDAVRDRVKTLGSGGGYIISSSHDISADTSTENILAMYEPALRAYTSRGR